MIDTIDTAPKNGTEILAWREDCGWMICRWIAPIDFITTSELEKNPCDSDEEEDWFYADFIQGGRLESDEAPTHWMPLPSDPMPSEQLPEDFRRIALLFTSRCTRTKMTAGEKRAWEGIGWMVTGASLELLEWFYGLDKSTEYDQTWHRKGQPAALLNNLNSQLDLAFALKEAMRKSQPKLGTAPQW